MTPAWRAPIAAVRWSLALAIAMYIFHWLMVFAFSPFGVVVATFPLLGVTDEALLFALGSLIFALISAISIGIGAVKAPHRYWRLAVGLLSIAVVLPMATLFIQETFISGDRAFDVTDLGALASVAAGGAVLYGVLHWLRARRIHRPALSNRSSLAILIAFACLLSLPVRTVTVPAWRLQFVDVREEPLVGLEIRQSWKDFAVDGQGAESEHDSAATDANGFVVFPARARWASSALRLWRPVDIDLTSFRHRRDGRYTRLSPLCPLRSLEAQGIMDYRDISLPDRLHLIEDDGPRGNLDPPCERLLDQVRTAQAPR